MVLLVAPSGEEQHHDADQGIFQLCLLLMFSPCFPPCAGATILGLKVEVETRPEEENRIFLVLTEPKSTVLLVL